MRTPLRSGSLRAEPYLQAGSRSQSATTQAVAGAEAREVPTTSQATSAENSHRARARGTPSADREPRGGPSPQFDSPRASRYQGPSHSHRAPPGSPANSQDRILPQVNRSSPRGPRPRRSRRERGSATFRTLLARHRNRLPSARSASRCTSPCRCTLGRRRSKHQCSVRHCRPRKCRGPSRRRPDSRTCWHKASYYLVQPTAARWHVGEIRAIGAA